MSSGGGGRSLGPGWRSGKGFQPPGPAVAADPPPAPTPSSPTSRNRSASHASADSGGWNEVVASGSKGKGGGGSNINHFAALDMDNAHGKTSNGTASAGPGSSSRRSEGLRPSGSSSFGAGAGGGGGGGGSSGGSAPSRRSGRSLADLAATLGPGEEASSGRAPRGGRGPGRESDRGAGGPRSSTRRTDDRERDGGSGGGPRGPAASRSSMADYEPDKNVIRYTREKLLSLRPPGAGTKLPEKLQHLEGVSVITDQANDPVCFDNFDPEEIWAQALKERRAAASVGGLSAPPGVAGRDRSTTGGSSRWQRGVALPPSDERRGRQPQAKESSNPDDLWDDPAEGPTSAAMDFSAFGGSLDDVPKASGGGGSGLGSGGFDLSDMSEAAKRFEEELHGTSKRASSGNLNGAAGGNDDEDVHTRKIDSHRPLASSGTEIRSGSGDDVNVFEDFGDPTADDSAPAPAPAEASSSKGSGGGIEAGGEQSASSRLMSMIGVGGSGEAAAAGAAVGGIGGGGSAPEPAPVQAPAPAAIGGGTIGGVPLNPWGEPMQQQQQQPQAQGLDLAARMEEERRARQQQEEQEARRRAEIERRQQEEAAARQAQQQQQGPSQVELILMERVCAILENSWGRSDLMSILSTLHAEDSRVIPLLGNVDALRALIARHPRRVQLAKDPSFGAEMAVLLLSNQQFQQAKAQEEQARAQEEELKRRQQMLQQQQQQQQQQAIVQEPPPPLIPNAPWFYTDPNGQVQGPFPGHEMRQWFEAGYFKADLPISQNPNAAFRALGHIFPDLQKAFQVPEPEPVPVPSSPVRAPVEEPQPVPAAAPEPVEPNQSSQLKAMLGLGGDNSAQAAPVVQEEVPVESGPLAKEPPKKSKAKKEKAPKAAKAAPAPVPEPAPVSSPVKEEPASAPTAPAWGGAAADKPAKKKSMSEIQQEEARVAARRAREQPSSGGGGWANIAASGGTTAWSGDAVKPAPRAAPPVQQAAVAAKQPKPRQAGAAAQSNKANSTTKASGDAFGESGKMSPALESWCLGQMKKISGSDDLTLLSFCMTLNDPMEIKQYLTAYLGSTPQVHNFANEFVLRKDGKKAQQEQWEAAGGKKGRKKKGGKN